MQKLNTAHIALGKKLRKFQGEATAELLACNYPDIEPLIRHGYVTVRSKEGIAIYAFTPAGLAWSETLK